MIRNRKTTFEFYTRLINFSQKSTLEMNLENKKAPPFPPTRCSIRVQAAGSTSSSPATTTTKTIRRRIRRRQRPPKPRTRPRERQTMKINSKISSAFLRRPRRKRRCCFDPRLSPSVRASVGLRFGKLSTVILFCRKSFVRPRRRRKIFRTFNAAPSNNTRKRKSFWHCYCGKLPLVSLAAIFSLSICYFFLGKVSL